MLILPRSFRSDSHIYLPPRSYFAAILARKRRHVKEGWLLHLLRLIFGLPQVRKGSHDLAIQQELRGMGHRLCWG